MNFEWIKKKDFVNMSASKLSGTLNIMGSADIASYLADMGISSQGMQAIRENQVDGEMFLELTENDIKDLFTIFKDRHLVRKILQGKDNMPLYNSQPVRDNDLSSHSMRSTNQTPSHSQPTRDNEYYKQPIRNHGNTSSHDSQPIREKEYISQPIRPQSHTPSRVLTKTNAENDLTDQRYYISDVKEKEIAGEQINRLKSYIKNLNPSDIYSHHIQNEQNQENDQKRPSSNFSQGHENTQYYAPKGVDLSITRTKDSKSQSNPKVNNSKFEGFSDPNRLYKASRSFTEGTECSKIKEEPKPYFQSAISQFLQTRSRLSALDGWSESKSERSTDSPWAGDQEESRFIPSVLTYRLTQFTGMELMSRKPKQGKPNEAQRLGQMVIREASFRAGIWDDPPCLQLLTSRQKQLFFEYSFMMAPNLKEYKDILWKRLGEALLNRRKYLRDKVLGKRGKRSEDNASSLDGEQDSASPDESEDQIPDTSTSPLPHKEIQDGPQSRSGRFMGGHSHKRAPSSTVSQSELFGYPVYVLDDSGDEEEHQAYPDSTMEGHEADGRNSEPGDSQKRRKRSFTESSSRNLSLLSSAACSALLREEAEYRHEVKQRKDSDSRFFNSRRISDSWNDFQEEEETCPDPPQDIEKVNLHKRLLLSKYESSSKHHPKKMNTDWHVPGSYESTSNQLVIKEEAPQSPEQGVSPNSADLDPGVLDQWDSFVMEEVPHVRIYSTIDRGISHYTGEELLAKKSKQGKPSEAQRLGQQVVRESAMMAKLWQDVPQSIRSITEEEKKVFFQCAFTLAPNLIPCRDLLWRRLGEALQNRRKYVRDRSLGKRPTKREQRLMKEMQQQQHQHQEIESDSQASLSSIQDIENTVRIKPENPDSFLKS